MTAQLIADAFQTGEMVVNGALVAVGLLAAATAFAVIAMVCLLFQLAARYRRACHEQAAKAQPFLEECTPPVQVTAALDLEPGRNLALQDECELLFEMPARQPGPERLWWAIRDEQQKKGD